MKLNYLRIINFKSIRDMEIKNIEDALILVGKNNTGKTVVMDAVRLVSQPEARIDTAWFNEPGRHIKMEFVLGLSEDDLTMFYELGLVSRYKNKKAWEREFFGRLPSFDRAAMTLKFTWLASYDGKVRFDDGFKNNNRYIPMIFPKVYMLDSQRNISELERDILMYQEEKVLGAVRENRCMFDKAKTCTQCFNCIGVIGKKNPLELNVLETTRLLEYQMIHLNMYDFTEKVNRYFVRNGGYSEEIRYQMDFDIDEVLKIESMAYHRERRLEMPVKKLSKGMRSIYMLSLLEAYIDERQKLPCVIMMEEPEIFLHPKLQKTAGEILYRLSQKNQVIFSTHSPNVIFNFTSRQIRQIVLDEDYYSVVRSHTDIDEILDDLGYSAADLMNVDFVFIVEGRQDKSRLPLLLDKYYSEITDKDGELVRVAIITTNSCTNIKTYANLKYMNQIYFKERFMMIRDSDGKDRDELTRQLCRYYDNSNVQDVDRLPRVRPENVLILKYYSFENYFLNPDVMTALGIVQSPEHFYEILFEKWQEYLNRLSCGRHFSEVTGIDIKSPEDLKNHMETFKIYMRGHNLFDIFYGRYKKNETEILKRYIELAPREDFADILGAIDRFIYFKSRKKGE